MDCEPSPRASGTQEVYQRRQQRVNDFNLRRLLRVWGPARGLVTNSELPVTVTHLTVAVLLGERIWDADDCDRNLPCPCRQSSISLAFLLHEEKAQRRGAAARVCTCVCARVCAHVCSCRI